MPVIRPPSFMMSAQALLKRMFFFIILTIFIAYKIFALKYDYGHPLRYPISYLFITALWLEIIFQRWCVALSAICQVISMDVSEVKPNGVFKNKKMLLKISKEKIVTYSLICVFVLLPECLVPFTAFSAFSAFSAFIACETFL